MKHFLSLALATMIFAACGNENTKEETTETTTSTETTTTSAPATAAVAKDPVCNMPKDGTWTEFSVNNTDTVWFCSPHCKETFDKDPSKYASVQ